MERSPDESVVPARVLAWLDALVARGRGQGGEPPVADDALRDALAAAAAAHVDAAEPPEDLVDAPSRVEPAAWHARRLAELLDAGAPPEHLGLHACWLGFLLSGGDPDRAPRVSVLTPVFDRAGPVVEAVDSALAQTHPGMEVVVVDDGSRDDPASTLASRLDRIRFIRQENAGVAAARNRALAAATGEYIQFLDSDDLLDADAVENGLAALRALPEAEVRASPWREHDPEGRRAADTGSRCYPESSDLLELVTRRTPFGTCGVILPRWRLRDLGGFDTRLRRAEDARLWFQLGLIGVRFCRTRLPRSTRRVSADSLTTDREATYAAKAPLLLLNLADLLGAPRAWPYVRPVARKLFEKRRLAQLDAPDDGVLHETRNGLLRAVERLGSGARLDGLSPGPALHALLDALEPALASSYARRVAAGVGDALDSAAALGASDVDFWLSPERAPGGGPEVRTVLGAVDASTRTAHPMVPLGRLHELTRARPGHRWARRWALLSPLARVFGEGVARGASRAIDAAARGMPARRRGEP